MSVKQKSPGRSDAGRLRLAGDKLLRWGCKNPYRAILLARARGLEPADILRAYAARCRKRALTESARALLEEFDRLVGESSHKIDAIRSARGAARRSTHLG